LRSTGISKIRAGTPLVRMKASTDQRRIDTDNIRTAQSKTARIFHGNGGTDGARAAVRAALQ
jgi:hypothetical protein